MSRIAGDGAGVYRRTAASIALVGAITFLGFRVVPINVTTQGFLYRQTAHEVEVRQLDLEELPPPINPVGDSLQSIVTGRGDRILVHVTADPSSAMVIRRAKRVADYLQADCFAVALHKKADLLALNAIEREAIERHLNFARNLHVEARLLEGEEVAKGLVDFARRNGVTQIFLARPKKRGLQTLFRRNLAQQVVQLARDLQVTIVAERSAD